MPPKNIDNRWNATESTGMLQRTECAGSFFTKCHHMLKILLIFTAICLVPTLSFSQLGEQLLNSDDPNQPWNIAADELTYNQETGIYMAEGRVSITKMDRKLTADFVRFNSQNMIAGAVGNVVLIAGEDILIGNSMEIDLESETGTITEGTIFIKEKHFYIRGDKIQKIGKETYTIEKASITTCDGDVPAWELTGRDLEVTLGGYGFVKHAALLAKKVPVLYSPFLIFPVKPDRQTGLLAPEFGLSDRKGFEYIQPLFLAIDESSDLTLYSHFMDLRGEKAGLEYRYILDETSKGAVMFDYLYDRQVDDGTPDSTDKWGYDDDNFRRNNRDRYWFRMKHDHALPNKFMARLDLDIVSDQDYLEEFKRGYTGFNETEDYFNEIFNRELDDLNDPIRVNRLNISRYWSDYILNTEVRWYDNVILRNRDWINDFTLQRLPFFGFDGLKQSILNSPLYFDLDSEYTYFYSEDGTRGNRTDIHPRIYLPYKFGNYFTIEPSVGLRGTAWHINEYENTGSEQSKDKSLYRGIYDLKLDFSSDIFKVYRIDGETLKGIKHTIRPQIVYDYIPYTNQDEYPLLNTSDENTNLVPLNDTINRINGSNIITYSITQTFTSKSEKPIKPDSESDDEADLNAFYNQFVWFKLEQSYNIYEEREDKTVNWLNQKDKRPFSPVIAELDIKPLEYLTFLSDAEWCPYDNRLLSGNAGIRLNDKRNDELYVEYRYDRNTLESVYTELTLRITDRFSAYGEYERNIRDSQSIETSIGLLYEAQCWSLDVGFTKEEDNTKVAALINLYGLGGFGKSTYFGKLRKTPGNYFPEEYSGYKDLYSVKPAALGAEEVSEDDIEEVIDLDTAVAELEEDLKETGETEEGTEPQEEAETSESAPAEEAVIEERKMRDTSSQAAEEEGDQEIKETTIKDTVQARETGASDKGEPSDEEAMVVSDLGIEESVIEDTRESLVNETREVLEIDYDEVKVGRLSRIVGIAYFENKTDFYAPNIEKSFHENLVQSVSREVGSNIILTEFNDADEQLPKLISGRIDNFALLEKGRQLGLNAIVTGSFIDIRPVREARGRIFKNLYDGVRLVVGVEVYDTETGAKLMDETFIHTADIQKIEDDDILEFSGSSGPKKEISIPALNNAVQQVIDDMSGQIAETLYLKQWKGYVTAIENHRIVISAGSDVGLAPGNRLEVYDKKIIEGLGGHRYFMPGKKTGEVLITDVKPHRSEAILVSGTVVKEGSTVKKR